MLIGGMAGAQVQDMPGGPKVNQLNLHEGVTQIARDVMWLHWMLLTICIVIFIGVFGVMFYSIWAHRKSRSHKAATFHEHLGVEVAWTVIPFIIVIAMALPATKTVVAMKDTSSADLTVKVTGYQWKWGYEYLDGSAAGVKFLHAVDAARPDREPRAQGPVLPDGSGQPHGCARRQEGPRRADRRRRDPLLDDPRLRRQAGRHSGLPARRLVPRRTARHLPWPMRRAVRQGSRLHAHRRGSPGAGGLR